MFYCFKYQDINIEKFFNVYLLYEGRPESKDRLRIALAQVNTPRRFKVARPQSSVGFVPSKFNADCII
jgi:hypothetical protein